MFFNYPLYINDFIFLEWYRFLFMLKKYSLLIAGITCISSPSFALDNNHSGFYITGKVGASVLQEKNQRYIGRYEKYDYSNDSYYNSSYNSQSSGTHTNARLGGGIAIGYNFDNRFNVPVRAEIDVMARMRDSSNYFSDRQTYKYYWIAKTTYDQHVDNKVQLNTFMFNAFYDFKNKSPFTPYLMAGAGLASFKHTSILSTSSTIYDTSDEAVDYRDVSRTRRSHTANNFAWNVGAGVKYKISENFDFDLSYRYLGAGKSSVTMWRGTPSPYYNGGYEKSKIKVISQDIMLGLTYNF